MRALGGAAPDTHLALLEAATRHVELLADAEAAALLHERLGDERLRGADPAGRSLAPTLLPRSPCTPCENASLGCG